MPNNTTNASFVIELRTTVDRGFVAEIQGNHASRTTNDDVIVEFPKGHNPKIADDARTSTYFIVEITDARGKESGNEGFVVEILGGRGPRGPKGDKGEKGDSIVIEAITNLELEEIFNS